MSVFRLLVLLVKEDYTRLDKDTKPSLKGRNFPIPGQQPGIQAENSNESSPLLQPRQFNE